MTPRFTIEPGRVYRTKERGLYRCIAVHDGTFILEACGEWTRDYSRHSVIQCTSNGALLVNHGRLREIHHSDYQVLGVEVFRKSMFGIIVEKEGEWNLVLTGPTMEEVREMADKCELVGYRIANLTLEF